MSILITFTLYRRCVHSTLSTSSRRTCRARFSRRMSPWCPGGLMTPMKRTVMKISWNLWWTRPAVDGWWWNRPNNTTLLDTFGVFWGFPSSPEGWWWMMLWWVCSPVSHHKGCPDSTSAMMFSFINMMCIYIVYTPRFTLPSIVCQMSLHCFHFHHSPFQGVSDRVPFTELDELKFCRNPSRCFFKPAQVASSDISYFKQVS